MFSRTALVLFIASAVVLFSLSVILSGQDDGTSEKSRRRNASADSYSTSAVGYAGLYEFLKRTGRPVARSSSGDAATFAGPYGTVIVAEPVLKHIDDYEAILSASRLLLILPKWEVTKDNAKTGWIAEATLIKADDVSRFADTAFDLELTVQRAAWSSWKINEIGPVPGGDGLVQLIRSGDITPLVANDYGTLLGEIEAKGQKIWILSDPDVMSNHGIGKAENALFMTELIDKLRFWQNSDANMPVVFDERVHGYQDSYGSPINLPFRFPYSVVAALVVCSGILMVFAGAGRFGPPRETQAPLDFGKTGLIDNSARLLDYAGHHSSVMKRYVQMTVRSVASALHAPPLKGNDLLQWLDQVGKSRGVSVSCLQIVKNTESTYGEDKLSLTRLYEYTKQIYSWKGEMLNGSAKNRNYR